MSDTDRKLPSEVMDTSGVNTDVAAFRETKYLVQFSVSERRICPKCGSGEVYQPMQTMDMPMKLSCLRCGNHAPSNDFNHTDD